MQIPKAALIDILTPYLEDDDAALSRLQNVPDVDGQVTTEALKAAGFDVLFDRKIVEINNVGRGEGNPRNRRRHGSIRSVNPSPSVCRSRTEIWNLATSPSRSRPIAPCVCPSLRSPSFSPACSTKPKLQNWSLFPVPTARSPSAIWRLRNSIFVTIRDCRRIVVRPGNGQRLANELSVASSRIKAGAGVVKPASFSGYVNVTGGADYLIEGRKAPSMYLDLQSAARMGGIVVENAGTYVGEIDPNVCPAYAQCTYSHEAGFKRQSSRIVYDSQEQQTRLQLGDFNMPGTAIQGANDVAGISFQKTARIFAPGESIRPSGNGSFSLTAPPTSMCK